MFPATQIPLTANGNIRPNRFLTTVTGTGNFLKCVEATDKTAIILGVSESGTRGPGGVDDTYIAIAGEHVPYRGPLQIGELKLGGTVDNMGIPLTTDNAGRGVADAPTADDALWYGAIALRAGVEDDVIPVYVLPPTPTI